MSLQNLIIGLIGSGNMSRALVRGLLRAGHPASHLHVADPDPAQLEQLRTVDAGITVHGNNSEVGALADVLVLAVKPQLMSTVSLTLASASRHPDQLVLSVAAGVTLSALQSWFGADTPIVRVMPNQPATIGAGVSGLVAATTVAPRDREIAMYVAASTGRALWLAEESQMDAVTAVSGSGPAYFYLLMEHMERAAVELGLPRELAATLTRETALGAARMVVESDADPARLRAAVTSPGGTTAAALQVFEAAHLNVIVSTALAAARDRSVELGHDLPGQAGPSKLRTDTKDS